MSERPDAYYRAQVARAARHLGQAWDALREFPAPEGAFVDVLRDQIAGIEQALRFRLENGMDLLEREG